MSSVQSLNPINGVKRLKAHQLELEQHRRKSDLLIYILSRQHEAMNATLNLGE